MNVKYYDQMDQLHLEKFYACSQTTLVSLTDI